MKRLISIFFIAFWMTGCSNQDPIDAAVQPVQVATKTQVSSKEGKKIRITNGEWIPYTGENLPGYGCDSQITSEVFQQIGYTVEYGFFPWARAMDLGHSPGWDGTLEWDDTEEWREDYFINSEVISNQEWVFFFRADRPFDWETKEDLQGKIIGITRGFLYSDEFAEQLEDNRYVFEEAGSDEANFQKLLAGRIDIFPMERNVGLAMLKERFSVGERNVLTYHPQPLASFYPHLLLSREKSENKDLIKAFDEALKKFKTTNRYAEILKFCEQ